MPEWEGFDWSGGHAEKNRQKHGVSAAESEAVFFNTPLLVAPDSGHSAAEQRLYALGHTDQGRRLFIAFTIRGRSIRVISARDMNRKERRVYES